MQLKDITKPLSEMTTEELLERVKGIRHNREIKRAAVVARTERAERKETRKTGNKAAQRIADAFANMSDEERQKLIEQLGG